MRDFFQTDWSALGVCIEEAAPANTVCTAKKTAKGHEVAGVVYTRSHSDQTRACITQKQIGHNRHTKHSRQAISNYHKRPDSVLRSAETQHKRTEGIRRSRANPSAKLLASYANPGRVVGATLAKQKPIMTPTGVFPSLKHAAEWAVANGLPNAYKKIGKWLKTHPELFYYITKDTK
jgi:hypothetical protein